MNGGDLFIELFFLLVSTSVAFVLISESECFSQDLTETLLILLSSLYLPALCITVSRDREQPAAPVRADKWSAPYNVSPNE